MSFFGGASNVTSAPSDMQARKEEMKQRISQELAVANAQTLINVRSRVHHFLAFGEWRRGKQRKGLQVEKR